MKNKKIIMLLSILMACIMCAAVAGCQNEGDGVSSPSESSFTDASDLPDSSSITEDEEKYTVKFMNGETIVSEVEAAKGELVDIPEDPTSADSRYTFVGWEGLDETDKAAGQVEVFADATYAAIWKEQFGSAKTFEAMQLRNIFTLTIDGTEEDAWLDATGIALDKEGSYVKFMWDATNIYIFANIVDSDITNDNLEVKIDLLHSEEYATDAWNGTDWGEKYRANYMVEGGYAVNAGAETISNFYWEWLSNGDQAGAAGKSVITETGYTVEMKIGTTNGSTPDFVRPDVDQVIGLSVRNLNKTTVAMESFAGYMDHGPKSLSNVKLVANENNDKDLMSVKEVRENYSIVVDNKEDLLYKDAAETMFGESKVKMLWAKEGVYLLATLGENTKSLKFESPLLGEAVEFTTAKSVNELKISSPNGFVLNSYADLTVSYEDGGAEAVVKEYIMKLEANPQNFGRNIYEAKKLAENQTITVDGTKDAAYGEEATMIIDTISLRENNGEPDNTGKAWIRWDDSNLYVYVEVLDDDVSTEQRGDSHNNDSVELWLSTCRTLPQNTTGWGFGDYDCLRPSADWCGEGGWRVQACNAALTGSHWMYDWADGVPREVAAGKLMDGETQIGYTVEYKIAWSTFADASKVPEKVGQIIDIMININEDDGQDGTREGIVSSNAKGCEAWHQPYVLDQLKLVAADTTTEEA